MRKLLLVLSAKYINGDLQQNFGQIPPVLLPYQNKELLVHICKNNSQQFDVKVVADEGYEMIADLVQRDSLDCEVVYSKNSQDLKQSIIAGGIEDYDQVVILMGDTFIKNSTFTTYTGDMIAYEKNTEAYEYISFNIDNGAVVVEAEQKGDNIFCGIFSISAPSLFSAHLNQASGMYEALETYSRKQAFEFKHEADWIDLGHFKSFLESEINEVEARYFNQILIDKKKGKLVKKSEEKKKFVNEINWYLNIPNNLNYITPRIFDYSTDYNNLFIEMEYYSYMTLHNLFVYGNANENKWIEIFNTLFETLDEFQKYSLKLETEEVNRCLRTIYYDKTIERLNALKEVEEFQKYFCDELEINGAVYPGLNKIIDTLENVIEVHLLNNDKFTVIHGDYFFANILYDSKSNFIRTVDPRGDFGGYGIYGDPRYDIAKLSHSVNGKYDFIIKDMFNLDLNNNVFSVNAKKDSNKLEQILAEKIQERYNIEEIKLIESLLFLSMVPLHKDYPQRQHVMLMTGITQYQKVLKNILQGD